MRLKSLFDGAFCIYPWIHLHADAAGRWALCCYSAASSIATIDDSDIAGAWNSPTMRHIRLKMLRGEPPEQCAVCSSLDEAGVRSRRVQANLEWLGHLWKADETRSDGTLNQPIVYLDVRFSNLCNLRCRMCGHNASSSWYDDAVALGETAASHRVIDRWSENDLFWRQLQDTVLPHIEMIYFAGGEPLMQDAHYRMLGALLGIGRTDVRLHYSTNMSMLDYKDHSPLKIWQQFEHVAVTASIDGVGERGDYIRRGLVWDHWVENVERLGSYLKGLATTISVYNMHHYPDLYTDLLDKFPGISQWQNLVIWPRHLSVQVFDQRMRRRLESRYATFLETEKRLSSRAKQDLESLIRYMNSGDQSYLAKKFKTYTARLDELRGENMREVFPELAEWYESI